MKLFAIQQCALQFQFAPGDDAPSQYVVFSEDPEDSSNVRLRITPAAVVGKGYEDDAQAVEIVFDRNGHERFRRWWPMKYAAWDTRAPTVIEAEEKARLKAEADASKRAKDEDKNEDKVAAGHKPVAPTDQKKMDAPATPGHVTTAETSKQAEAAGAANKPALAQQQTKRR